MNKILLRQTLFFEAAVESKRDDIQTLLLLLLRLLPRNGRVLVAPFEMWPVLWSVACVARNHVSRKNDPNRWLPKFAKKTRFIMSRRRKYKSLSRNLDSIFMEVTSKQRPSFLILPNDIIRQVLHTANVYKR